MHGSRRGHAWGSKHSSMNACISRVCSNAGTFALTALAPLCVSPSAAAHGPSVPLFICTHPSAAILLTHHPSSAAPRLAFPWFSVTVPRSVFAHFSVAGTGLTHAGPSLRTGFHAEIKPENVFLLSCSSLRLHLT